MGNKAQIVDVCAARFARLDASGVPEPGAENVIVTHDIVTARMTTEIETGTRTTQKDGCGNICFSRETPDKVIGSNLEVALCYADSEIAEMIAGHTLLTEGAETIGDALPSQDAPQGPGVGVEVWTKAFVGDQQMLHPVSGQPAYWRYVWPRMRFSTTGDVTLQEGIQFDTYLGKGEANENFHDGPGNDVPLGWDGPRARFLSDSLPAATDGYATLAAS